MLATLLHVGVPVISEQRFYPSLINQKKGEQLRASFEPAHTLKKREGLSSDFVEGAWWSFAMKEKHAAGLLCGAVGVALYLNTLNCGFCYDDKAAVLENTDLLPGVSWTQLLQNDFWGKPLHLNTSHKSYRPLCVATFRLNYLLHGLDPMGYHLVNVVLHAVVCYLYVQLCAMVFNTNSVWPALTAGLLFAVHPIHTEAVSCFS